MLLSGRGDEESSSSNFRLHVDHYAGVIIVERKAVETAASREEAVSGFAKREGGWAVQGEIRISTVRGRGGSVSGARSTSTPAGACFFGHAVGKRSPSPAGWRGFGVASCARAGPPTPGRRRGCARTRARTAVNCRRRRGTCGGGWPRRRLRRAGSRRRGRGRAR